MEDLESLSYAETPPPVQQEVIQVNKYKRCKICILNLHPNITEELLGQRFGMFGHLCSVKVSKDEQQQSRGIGYVTFSTPDEAQLALNTTDRSLFFSMEVRVLYVEASDEYGRNVDLQMQRRVLAEEEKPSQKPAFSPSEVFTIGPSTSAEPQDLSRPLLQVVPQLQPLRLPPLPQIPCVPQGAPLAQNLTLQQMPALPQILALPQVPALPQIPLIPMQPHLTLPQLVPVQPQRVVDPFLSEGLGLFDDVFGMQHVQASPVSPEVVFTVPDQYVPVWCKNLNPQQGNAEKQNSEPVALTLYNATPVADRPMILRRAIFQRIRTFQVTMDALNDLIEELAKIEFTELVHILEDSQKLKDKIREIIFILECKGLAMKNVFGGM